MSKAASRGLSTRGNITGGFGSVVRDSMNSQSYRADTKYDDDEEASPKRQTTASVQGQRNSLEASLSKWEDDQYHDGTPPRVKQTRVGGATFINSANISEKEQSEQPLKDTPLAKHQAKREKVAKRFLNKS